MAVRFKNGRDCPTCATPAKTAIAKASAQAPVRVLTSEGESQYLWRHVLYGAGTIVGLIAGYAKGGLQGEPRDEIKALIATLDDALKALDERAGNEIPASGERLSVDSSADPHA